LCFLLVQPANVPLMKYTNEMKPVFLGVFASTVLASPELIQPGTFQLYRPLLRTLRAKDFAALLPSVDRYDDLQSETRPHRSPATTLSLVPPFYHSLTAACVCVWCDVS